MPADDAPPVTFGVRVTHETPKLILITRGLLSKWGFDDGDPFDEVEEWWHDQHGSPPMGHCDCGFFDLGVDARELLVEVVKRFVLPVLDQQVQVEVIETSHNPIRACCIDGVGVPDAVHYRDLPEPVTLTPDAVEISYETVVEIATEMRAAARRKARE